MEVRTALSVRAPRVSRRGTAEKAYVATSSVPASGLRDATRGGSRRASARSRALGTHLHHGCRSSIVGTVIHRVRRTEGAQCRSTGLLSVFRRRSSRPRESREIYTVHSTSSDKNMKTLSKIQNLRTEISSDFLERLFARRGEARDSRSSMKSPSRLCKSAHLRRRLCHSAGAFRTHAPSNADARDARR